MDPKDEKKPQEPALEDKPKEFTHDEIANTSMEELLGGLDLGFEQPKEEAKPEEKPTEPVVETPAPVAQAAPTVQEKVEEAREVIDVDKLREEISDATAKKIVEQLAPQDATKEEKKDLLADAPWKKENRNPSWEEALTYVGKQASDLAADKAAELASKKVMDQLNKEVEDEEKTKVETQKQQEMQTEQNRKLWDDYWNNQLVELEQAGRIQKVVNAMDKNDPGIKDRQKLFTALNERVKEAFETGKPANYSLHDTYWTKIHQADGAAPAADGAKEEGANKNAPVAGAVRTSSGNNTQEFTHEEIKNSSWADLLAEANGIQVER